MADSMKIRFISFTQAAKSPAKSSKQNKSGSDARSVFVVFAGDDAALSTQTRKTLGTAAHNRYKRAAEAAAFHGKRGSSVEILGIEGFDADQLVAVGTGKKGKLDKKPAAKSSKAKSGDDEKRDDADYAMLGGQVMGKLGSRGEDVTMLFDLLDYDGTAAQAAAEFAMGLRLRAYRFDTYKTKQGKEKAPGNSNSKSGDTDKTINIAIAVADPAAARRAWNACEAIVDGVCTARDLVNEPANILTPVEFAKRAKTLTKLGVKVDILDERAMKRLGMGALLGVGQGSVNPSRLVVMRWNGARSAKAQPIAFVGKGVTFDTGGVSIKPAGGMEDMKGDMAGAACVTGLMQALASRKAKANVIGCIGLVENMVDGTAQRPGDIVTTMSKQTVEVINTDAEGRLVLADALWYIQDKYKPQFMVNLATLTGAILVSLGQEYAGLFSNNDELSERLKVAGEATGEKVWRMPLAPGYDKMINSKFADMKNIGGRFAGSITAAQFLQRFVNKVPWSHLDIAGTGFGSKQSDINKSWGSGWGVRLLDRLVADHYES